MDGTNVSLIGFGLSDTIIGKWPSLLLRSTFQLSQSL